MSLTVDSLPAAFEDADEIVLAEVFGADQIDPADRLDPDRLVADIASNGGFGGIHGKLLAALEAKVRT